MAAATGDPEACVYVVPSDLSERMLANRLPEGNYTRVVVGLHDGGLSDGVTFADDVGFGLVAGNFLQETAERIFRDHGNIDRSDLLRGCGFIRLLGIQAGCDAFLLSSITRRCDGKRTGGTVLCPVADVCRICFRDIRGVEEVYRTALS